MDLKSKGITWVGNICQKFETMCSEVDNILNQDTVKYVENQVNTVGVNMKRFYAEVVQDINPLLQNSSKNATHVEPSDTNPANFTSVQTTIKIQGDDEHSNNKEKFPAAEERPPIFKDAEVVEDIKPLLQNAIESAALVVPSNANPAPHSSTQSISRIQRDDENIILEEKSPIVAERSPVFEDGEVVQVINPLLQNATKVAIQVVPSKTDSATNTSSESTIRIQRDDDHIIDQEKFLTAEEQPPVFEERSYIELMYSVPPKDRKIHASSELHSSDQLGAQTFEEVLEGTKSDVALGDTKDVLKDENSDVNFEENEVEETSTRERLELFSSDMKESLEESLLNEFIDDDCNVPRGLLAEVSHVTSLHGENFQYPQREKVACGGFSVGSDCLYKVRSAISLSSDFPWPTCEEKIVQDLACSNSSLKSGHCSELENSFYNTPTIISSCNDPSSGASHGSCSSGFLLSSTSGTYVCCNNEMEDGGTTSSNSIISLESMRSSSSCGYISDDMEEMDTVDLTDKVKPEESCVTVDIRKHHGVFSRPRTFRSYKKMIKDAFTHKKRLIKEYEQLAILYGDPDSVCGQDTMQRHLCPSGPLASELNLQNREKHDSDWELL
ncbi:hypothetical protein K2173_006732 [Erythroxylum novogranatense]|uniref:Uncharacterized protein n=1 Tax=Erythroxylum novogranatense TaxID=1862640 RepID=A0AAV8TD23_9ROSI|nr:hypothetical protein K2173_006732 [Erythroxylum novogranatense]